MTIDPKAAELAKALADAVAAQQTEEYQALAEAAKRKEEIDETAEAAAKANRDFYSSQTEVPVENIDTFGRYHLDYAKRVERETDESRLAAIQGIDASIFDPPSSDPAHYELPTDEDETATAKPNGGLSD